MKKIVLLSLFVVIAIFAFLSGCESDGTTSLQLDPSYIDLTSDSSSSNGTTQTFTVVDGLRDLSLPLEWSVSNPSLGVIGVSGGNSASYIVTGGHGNNSIYVKDQYGAEGVATVKQ